MESADFDSVADELYGLRREEFTSARADAATRAKKAGEKDLAARIMGLRKPTIAAELVNRLARSLPDELGELTELGDALRGAHSELAGDALRELSKRRHDLVASLTAEATGLASEQVSESVSREVSETFEAALAERRIADEVALGRLSTALRPEVGFGADWLGSAPVKRRVKAKGEAAERKGAEAKRRKEQLKEARQHASEVRREHETARSRLREAEKNEAKARQVTSAARAAVDETRVKLDDAEAVLAELTEFD
ncbi:hypothetical protein BAY61_29780 [Prauserella marina]|uniref:Uncharacterized protein n=1 Tax=Prauserella marina TaxID=530584 RepID=A0A222VX32_9PSEU|nr:hypothetical protein [Prauserella marina]ASR38499.1 hypothetical protein BAY61_29780 [Prauserella marina]PWV81793.1 hypothetical protein DES30_10223 [Prauserella marina]SDD12453.1 hypothetical protein SAMN05421630_10623 [Prauserella marina]